MSSSTHQKQRISDSVPEPGIEPNDLFNPELLALLVKKYLTFYPLFANVDEGGRAHNAIVENFFGKVKNIILKSVVGKKTTRVIRAIRNHIVATSKEILGNIPKGRPSRKRKHAPLSFQGSVDNPEEQWGKRSRMAHSYFKKSYLARATSQAALSAEVANDGLPFWPHNGVIKTLDFYRAIIGHPTRRQFRLLSFKGRGLPVEEVGITDVSSLLGVGASQQSKWLTP